MANKLNRLAAIGLAGCLVQSSLATDYHWTGLANDGLWASAGNWDHGVPTPGGGAFLDAANGWAVLTIVSGETETASDTIYGPEWGVTLNVHGALKFSWYLAPVQWDSSNPSLINLYDGSSITGEGIALGDNWWYSGGPYVTMNMYGNAFAGINYMYWGGRLNMYGGIMSITNGLTVETVGAVSDATRSINLAGGKLILPGAFAGTVTGWISRGILLAYGKAQDASDVVIDQITLPGRTIVTTIPLGGFLQDIHLQSLPTSLVAGASLTLTVLGNYPNVGNVVLTALDPSTLPGTMLYQSSAPGVATVDAHGLVTAIAPGSATLTATLGAFASTNSISITVTPVAQLPQEQPVYGYGYVHDPSTMIKDGSFYYIFGDGQGINVSYSSDLRNWNYASPVFPGNPPAWTTNAVTGFNGYFWAPDIVHLNGKYYLYYAASDWGTITSAIGLVTSPSLNSPVWTDQGAVIQYASGISYNCIDPSILVDTNGTLWLSFGSYSDGIFVMQLDPATGKRMAANSPLTKIADSSPIFFSNGTEGSCLYQRGSYYYLFLNWGGCCSGVDSTYNIRVGRSTSVTGPYLDRSGISLLNGGGSMFLESSGRFIGPGHAGVMNDNGTNWFTYHYYDGNNNGSATLGVGRLTWSADDWPVFTNDWSAFYPFQVDAREHLGLYNGTLQNGAMITNEPGRGSVLSLDGISQYARLPDPVANAGTFAGWVKWNGGGTWQRIFDFGNGTTQYLFLTPRAVSGNLRFAITTNGNGAEQILDAPTALPTNSWCHVAVTLDGAKGLLYLDGIPVATNNNLTIRPWQTLAKTNYIGKSQFAGDPMFDGRIASFRIFGRALSSAEIRDLAYAQPALAHRYSFTSATANAWDSIGMAHGLLAGNATIANNALNLGGISGDYVNLPGGLVSGASAATIEFWATFGVNGASADVFDFGNISGANGSQYLYFTPHTGTGTHRAEISSGSTAYLDVPGTLDQRAVCVAFIIDPATGYSAIYTNGFLEQAVTNALPALSGVNAAWSFLGRSLSSADAWLNGTVDEFRIYDGRLTPQEIAADCRFGPDTLALPVTLQQSNAAPGISLWWPSWAVGFAPESAATLASGMTWLPLAQKPLLANNQWTLMIPTTNAAQFYHLRR